MCSDMSSIELESSIHIPGTCRPMKNTTEQSNSGSDKGSKSGARAAQDSSEVWQRSIYRLCVLGR